MPAGGRGICSRTRSAACRETGAPSSVSTRAPARPANSRATAPACPVQPRGAPLIAVQDARDLLAEGLPRAAQDGTAYPADPHQHPASVDGHVRHRPLVITMHTGSFLAAARARHRPARSPRPHADHPASMVLSLGSAAPGLLGPFSLGDDLATERTMATETPPAAPSASAWSKTGQYRRPCWLGTTHHWVSCHHQGQVIKRGATATHLLHLMRHRQKPLGRGCALPCDGRFLDLGRWRAGCSQPRAVRERSAPALA